MIRSRNFATFGSQTEPFETIRITERSDIDLAEMAWKKLAAESSFWDLVRKGFVRISQPRRGTVRLHAQGYVGRALIGDTLLEIVEKVPGTLAAFLAFANGRSLRLERLASPATELGPLMALLVREFLAEVRTYVTRGRDLSYESAIAAGSLVAGKIDVSRTLSFRARGLGHLVAFRRSQLTARTPLNRIVLAALYEVGRIGRLVPVETRDLALARGYADLFAENRDQLVLFGPRSTIVRQGEQMLEASAPAHPDLLALAVVVLSNASFEFEPPESSLIPRAWFLSLERLFERAIRGVAGRLLQPPLRVSKISRPLFIGGEGQQLGTPDIIVRRFDICVCVGDAKYKLWEAAPEEEDLYQLIAHCDAFGSDLGFLVYPSDRFEHRFLGRVSTGPRIHLFSLDVKRLEADFERAVRILGLA